ncbi:hypothetical protein HDU85_007104 [Gaertneriomyces sp. JEL0708]|nr:hypothetical protein HDU85_007104 [Gaertneriomyces sp. JEL0708]
MNATANGQLSIERAREVLAKPKLTRRGNPVDVRRLFLFELYQEVLSSRALFVMQNNNMTAKEYHHFKNELGQKGFKVLTIRNGVFGAVVRQRSQELRADGQSDKSVKGLNTLLVGPTVVAFSNSSDEQHPTLTKDFAQIVKKYQKLLVVGAKFDGGVLTADILKAVTDLPPMSQLRAELVGVLSQPAQSLVGLLQRTPMSLLMSLQQHQSNLDADGTKEKAE